MTDRPRVLLTGVSGGIGSATARLFAARGWEVLGTDLDPPPSGLELAGFVTADLAAPGGVRQLFEELGEIHRLDALVNNAARQLDRPLIETSDQEWDAVMNANLKAAFACIRAAHLPLGRARGAVVNVSSVHAVASSINVAAYAVSKAGLVALTRNTALELAADGIRCNAVLPGAVDTAMLRAGLGRRSPQDPTGDVGLTELASRIPLGFVASPDQIAPTILHLADRAASPYTTGQAIVVDGGATALLATEP